MLYFIFIEYGVYIFFGDFRQKKTRKQTKFNIDQEQVAPSTHQHTHSCLF